MSGYDIKKAIDGSIKNFWTEDYGRIYPELKQMEKDGYVTRISEVKERGPQRNLFKISEKGKHEFEKWVRLPAEKQQTRNELLLKVFFGNSETIDNLIQQIEKEKEENQFILKRYAQIEESIDQSRNSESSNEASFWHLTLLYGKYKAEAALRWCDESLCLFKKMKEETITGGGENNETHI